MFDDYSYTQDTYDYSAYCYTPTYEDPMAYVVPATPDAFAFDMSAANAGVGIAMNEVARANEMARQAMLDDGVRIAESYAMPYTVRDDGWPEVSNANLLGHTVAEVSAYYRAKFDYEIARYGKIISLQ